MAKETEGAAGKTSGDQTEILDDVVEDNSLGSLLSLAGIVNGEKVAKLITEKEKPADKTVKKTETPIEKKVDEPAEEEEEEEEDEEEEEEEDEDDPFGGKKVKEKAAEDKPTKEIDDFLKKKTGKSAKEVFELLEQVDVLKQEADYGRSIKLELAAFPEPLREAVAAHIEGKDYTEAFKEASARPDFTKSFTANGAERIALAYAKEDVDDLKKQLEDEEIDQKEYDKEISKIARLKKDVFDAQKSQYETQLRTISDQAKKDKADMEDSINEALKILEEKIPGYKKKSELKSIMTKGVDQLMGVIFNKGKFTKDAAVRIAFLLDPDAVLKRVAGSAKKAGVTEANLKIVDSANKKVSEQRKNTAQQKELPKEVMSVLPLLKKSTY